MKRTILKGGLFRKSNIDNPKGGELSLDKWAKRLFTNWGIPFQDPCCPANTEIPVSLEDDRNCYGFNYFDYATQTWLPVTCLRIDTINETTLDAGVTIEDVLIENGGIISGGFIAPFYPQAAQQSLSGAGAANVTSYLTMLTSTGAAEAVTLANGTVIGQLKKLRHLVDSGSIVLTPANLAGGTVITFTTVGETALLQWNGTDWIVLELTNENTAILPVLS